MSFKTRVIETLRSVFFAHPSTKIPHGMMNASDTIYRKTAPGSQPEASIPNHTVPETAISYYKRDLRKGVDFSDPTLPKMTMTTFDGQPYIETYALSKLEIIPDFGTEHKVAPTPGRPVFWKDSKLSSEGSGIQQ